MNRKKNPETLEQMAERLAKHTMYCCWRNGCYDKTLGCTCGRDELIRRVRQLEAGRKEEL